MFSVALKGREPSVFVLVKLPSSLFVLFRVGETVLWSLDRLVFTRAFSNKPVDIRVSHTTGWHSLPLYLLRWRVYGLLRRGRVGRVENGRGIGRERFSADRRVRGGGLQRSRDRSSE